MWILNGFSTLSFNWAMYDANPGNYFSSLAGFSVQLIFDTGLGKQEWIVNQRYPTSGTYTNGISGNKKLVRNKLRN